MDRGIYRTGRGDFERQVKKLKTTHTATRILQTAGECHKEKFSSIPSFQVTQNKKI